MTYACRQQFEPVCCNNKINNSFISLHYIQLNSDKQLITDNKKILVEKGWAKVNSDLKSTNYPLKDTGITQSAKIKEPHSKKAIAGFICGLSGFLLFTLIWVPIFLRILGIIFSISGLHQTNKSEKITKRGKGFAIVGLILGILALIGVLTYATIIIFFPDLIIKL
jgi:hypothetical protein